MNPLDPQTAGERQSTVRVVIVDDHPLVRKTIRRFLESERGFEVVAETGTCQGAHRAVVEHRPDIMLLDLALDGESGFRVLDAMRDAEPAVPVLVVSLHSEVLYAPQCIEAGARGYVMKSDAPDHLVAAIRRVLDGGIYLSRNVGSARIPT